MMKFAKIVHQMCNVLLKIKPLKPQAIYKNIDT